MNNYPRPPRPVEARFDGHAFDQGHRTDYMATYMSYEPSHKILALSTLNRPPQRVAHSDPYFKLPPMPTKWGIINKENQ